MSTVEDIVNAARTLPPEQQAELKRRLEELGGPEDNGRVLAESDSSQNREELHARIHQALYEAGLVTDANPPTRQPRERHPPITIKGKPLSETIIEDRR